MKFADVHAVVVSGLLGILSLFRVDTQDVRAYLGALAPVAHAQRCSWKFWDSIPRTP